jgi:hypothetical protein
MIFQKIKDWNRWNRFIMNNEGASFLNYSFWLETYCVIPILIRKIGFELIDGNQIIGGISGVKIGFWKFSYIVFPAGPLFVSEITEVEKVSFFKLFFENRILNAKRIQFATDIKLFKYHYNLSMGKVIKFVYLNSGYNLISIKENEQEQLVHFKSKVRRDINASLRKGLDLIVVDNEIDLKTVYDVFKQNAIAANYKIRPYWFYKKSWIASLKSGQSIFLMAQKESQIKGAIWLIDCGKKLHYIMGGTVKEKPDLNVGYFLQWYAIKFSILRKYTTYNISVGGSDSVKQFKSDFGAEYVNQNLYLWMKE